MPNFNFVLKNIDLGWSKENFKRILWNAVVVGVSAILTYLLEQLPSANFGVYTPFIVAAISFGLKSALEYIRKG